MNLTNNKYLKKINSFKFYRGFTLIELLVVVSIIGMLASVAIYNISLARIKSRDARRLADLAQMRKAIELYYDEYNHYPIVANWATSEATTYDDTTKWNSLQTLLSKYIKLPNDPHPVGTSGPWYAGNYHYAYGSGDGKTYDLVAQLEDKNNINNCEHKCWNYHRGEGSYPPDTSWCGGEIPGCGGSEPWSRYIVADH